MGNYYHGKLLKAKMDAFNAETQNFLPMIVQKHLCWCGKPQALSRPPVQQTFDLFTDLSVCKFLQPTPLPQERPDKVIGALVQSSLPTGI